MSNIYNLFKFLEKKKGTKTPLRVKFLYAPDELTDEDLNVEGNLDLFDTSLTSLPDGLKVGGDLNLGYAPITSLPDNLKVGGNLYLYNTSLAKEYDEIQIGQMIGDKGGYVKGVIFV